MAGDRAPGSSDEARAGIVRSWWIAGALSVGWLIVVTLAGLWSRVGANWEAAATMTAGSFLAGSSPEGGGAVAFPVFTKALHVPAPVARTFGLSIQAVGMSMAAVSIVLCRRLVVVRAIALGTAASIVGLVAGLTLAGDRSVSFWPSTVPTPWVKVVFSIVLATTSILMLRHLRSSDHEAESLPLDEHRPLAWGWRFDGLIVLFAGVGGVLSSMAGTGANILVFVVLVVVAGVRPAIALPSAVVVMALTSIVGIALLGIVDGQLAPSMAAAPATTAGAEPADLFGLWMAAVPVVIWGAPLGAFAASLVAESVLVRFVAALAAFEVATTIALVPEIRTEWPLGLTLVVGLVALPGAIVALARRREGLMHGDAGQVTVASSRP